ncbi:Uncharacterised protein [Mycobacteroides abscessus subsp. massiliense]|nr:Uncharacterised protein [Mycobacteroides abscessus subsp. massiliense]
MLFDLIVFLFAQRQRQPLQIPILRSQLAVFCFQSRQLFFHFLTEFFSLLFRKFFSQLTPHPPFCFFDLLVHNRLQIREHLIFRVCPLPFFDGYGLPPFLLFRFRFKLPRQLRRHFPLIFRISIQIFKFMLRHSHLVFFEKTGFFILNGRDPLLLRFGRQRFFFDGNH